jgi:hypothetical protein
MSTLSASWTGGAVASWLVLGGQGPTALAPLTSVAASAAQASISLRSEAPYFAVQALGSSGQVLATSAVVAVPSHVTIYGHSAFVPAAGGLAGLPVGCHTAGPCHISLTITAGRTVLARTGAEPVGAGNTGIVYFTLTPRGRSLLASAHGGRLAVTVEAADASGATATVGLNLNSFTTSGTVARRSLATAASVRIVGLTAFVSGGSVGAVLASCPAPAPCSLATTLSVGRTVIARTSPQTLGENEAGYLLFTLTPEGRALLARARGNQLLARFAVANGTSVATAQIALVRF